MERELTEYFGEYTFNEATMKKYLSAEVYSALKRTIDSGEDLSPEDAEAVAAAMKTWAIERGATHFTHWFQPMTGVTAEKHDSFISPVGDGSTQRMRMAAPQ